jgi:hypothetical protein
MVPWRADVVHVLPQTSLSLPLPAQEGVRGGLVRRRCWGRAVSYRLYVTASFTLFYRPSNLDILQAPYTLARVQDLLF